MHNALKIAVHHEKLWSLLGLDLKLSVGVPLIVEIAGFYKELSIN